jgi:hypothetical protein
MLKQEPKTGGKVARLLAGDLLVLVTVFLVAELLVRLIAPQPVHRLLRHVYEATDQGYRFKANVSTICNIGYGDHVFAINSWRARDKDYGPKQPGETRILGLGNSYSENQALEVEDIWPNVLEANLAEAYPDRVFSVVNAGQAGWGLWNYYRYLEEMLPVIDPDVAVMLFGNTNDFKASSERSTPAPMKLWAGLPTKKNATMLERIERSVWFANEMMEEWSHAYVGLRRATYYPGLWLGITRVPHLHPLYTNPGHGEEMVEPTSKIVAEIRELCSEHDVQLVMMSIPPEQECIPEAGRFRVQIERPDVTTLDYELPIRLVRRVAEAADVPLYYPGPDLAAAEGRTYFLMFKHWNELGNRVVARGLQRFLDERRLLDKDGITQ